MSGDQSPSICVPPNFPILRPPLSTLGRRLQTLSQYDQFAICRTRLSAAEGPEGPSTARMRCVSRTGCGTSTRTGSGSRDGRRCVWPGCYRPVRRARQFAPRRDGRALEDRALIAPPRPCIRCVSATWMSISVAEPSVLQEQPACDGFVLVERNHAHDADMSKRRESPTNSASRASSACLRRGEATVNQSSRASVSNRDREPVAGIASVETSDLLKVRSCAHSRDSIGRRRDPVWRTA